MERTRTAGRVLLGVGLAVFGVQDGLEQRLAPGFLPAQDWTPPLPIVAYALGGVLFTVGTGLLHPRHAAKAAYAAAIVLGLAVVIVNYSHLRDVYAFATPRTRFFEPLALGGAALVLGAALGPDRHDVAYDRIGRAAFAFSLGVFGVQHFLYAPAIAALVPAWMPAHLQTAYFTGGAFIAAAIAVVTGTQLRLGATALALMFASWVALLHAPRAFAEPKSAAEWASLFVAVAMCGGALIVACPPALPGVTRRW